MTYVWLVLGSFFTGIIKDKQNMYVVFMFVCVLPHEQAKDIFKSKYQKANEIFLTVTNFGAV